MRTLLVHFGILPFFWNVTDTRTTLDVRRQQTPTTPNLLENTHRTQQSGYDSISLETSPGSTLTSKPQTYSTTLCHGGGGQAGVSLGKGG